MSPRRILMYAIGRNYLSLFHHRCQRPILYPPSRLNAAPMVKTWLPRLRDQPSGLLPTAFLCNHLKGTPRMTMRREAWVWQPHFQYLPQSNTGIVCVIEPMHCIYHLDHLHPPFCDPLGRGYSQPPTLLSLAAFQTKTLRSS